MQDTKAKSDRAPMMVRGIPAALRKEFVARCQLSNTTARAEVERFMERYVNKARKTED